MPWRDPSLPPDVRNAIYDAFIQGTRLRTAGWSVEQIKAEGFKEILIIPTQSVWNAHRKLIEDAFWSGFEAD
jgi:hypothetical protein